MIPVAAIWRDHQRTVRRSGCATTNDRLPHRPKPPTSTLAQAIRRQATGPPDWQNSDRQDSFPLVRDRTPVQRDSRRSVSRPRGSTRACSPIREVPLGPIARDAHCEGDCPKTRRLDRPRRTGAPHLPPGPFDAWQQPEARAGSAGGKQVKGTGPGGAEAKSLGTLGTVRGATLARRSGGAPVASGRRSCFRGAL